MSDIMLLKEAYNLKIILWCSYWNFVTRILSNVQYKTIRGRVTQKWKIEYSTRKKSWYCWAVIRVFQWTQVCRCNSHFKSFTEKFLRFSLELVTGLFSLLSLKNDHRIRTCLMYVHFGLIFGIRGLKFIFISELSYTSNVHLQGYNSMYKRSKYVFQNG